MARINIDVNEDLIKEGLKLTHMNTKKELVNYALEELVKKLKRKRILRFEGRVAWQGNLNEIRASRVLG